MGQDEGVRLVEVAGVQVRLAREDVQPGRRHPAVPKARDEGVVVHQIAAAYVDQDHARLDLIQHPPPEEAAGLVGGGAGQDEHVRHGRQLRNCGDEDRGVALDGPPIGVPHAHPEGSGPRGDLASDRAHADDPE